VGVGADGGFADGEGQRSPARLRGAEEPDVLPEAPDASRDKPGDDEG
jgi:hypothetical protein